MSRKQVLGAVCAAICWYVPVSPIVSAAAIFAGPAYDSVTGTGYESPWAPNRGAGIGVGVGTASKHAAGDYLGSRGVRWDASGAMVELANLGTDARGYTVSGAYGINSAGTAVGHADKYVDGSNKGDRAVRWDAFGTATELGHLGTSIDGFTISSAHAINDAGTTVGVAWSRNPDGGMTRRAVRWDASATTATELGGLGADSAAFAVNDAGTVVGCAFLRVADEGKGFRAVRWDASGTSAMELGNLGTDASGFSASEAYTINDAGAAVGYASKYINGIRKGERAVRWDIFGAAKELEDLGTDLNGFARSDANAINNAGTAVGYADKYVAGSWKGLRAVRWDVSGAAVELGNLGVSGDGTTDSNAFAINDAGMAVGYADKYDTSGNLLGSRAVMWGPDGLAIDLNTLIDPSSGWLDLALAFGISDDNWITGLGRFDPDGTGPLPAYDRLFLLHAPIPEPGAMTLLAAGALAFITRRRHPPRNLREFVRISPCAPLS